jgi:Methyltransferase domain
MSDSRVALDPNDLRNVTTGNYKFRSLINRRYIRGPKFLWCHRFHGIEKNDYHFPNDEEEQQRLNDLQYAIRNHLGTNVLVPLSQNASNILDVGTGSGAWCVEVADEYPLVMVRGIDLSPVQPARIPLNCQFIVMDLNDGLLFDNESYDLVHSRWNLSSYVLKSQNGASGGFEEPMASLSTRHLSHFEARERMGTMWWNRSHGALWRRLCSRRCSTMESFSILE